MEPFLETTTAQSLPMELLALRLLVNGVVIMVLIFGIYHRFKGTKNPNRDLTFTFVIFNLLIFFTASLLAISSMKTGIAFALFAVFSILRYRTVQMEIVDMTFLFIAIIIAVINSTVTRSVSTIAIAGIDCFIIGFTALLGIILFRSKNRVISIRFEQIELLHVARQPELFAELQHRIGLAVESVEIVQLNYTQDLADLLVSCTDKRSE